MFVGNLIITCHLTPFHLSSNNGNCHHLQMPSPSNHLQIWYLNAKKFIFQRHNHRVEPYLKSQHWYVYTSQTSHPMIWQWKSCESHYFTCLYFGTWMLCIQNTYDAQINRMNFSFFIFALLQTKEYFVLMNSNKRLVIFA
jgi:hypothetical protein